MTLPDTPLAIEALRPGEEGYEQAARVLFADGRPALVARPREAAEVATVVRFAVEHDLVISVRSGGHSMLGHGTNTGGVVIDLRLLAGIEVLDEGRRLVRLSAGATWGEVAAALGARGWGLSSGDTADVGVGGLTLGGGIGWLVRKHGLTIDSLVGARLVTAEGRLLRASPEENADLLRRWRDVMRLAPDALSSTLMLAPRVPGGAPSATVLLCFAAQASGSDDDAAIAPLRQLGTVTRTSIAQHRYADILEDARLPPGMRLVARNSLVPTLDEDLLAAVNQFHSAAAPAMVAVRSLRGAFGRVPAGATAFAHRDAEAMIVGGRMLPETATGVEAELAIQPWRAVADHGTGTYINFQGSATPDDLAVAYPPATYARLASIKQTYDPQNVFACNHNIRPEPPGGESLAATGRPAP